VSIHDNEEHRMTRQLAILLAQLRYAELEQAAHKKRLARGANDRRGQTCRRSCRVVAVSLALCVSACGAAARPTHRLEQRPRIENSITRPAGNTPALSGLRRTSLSTGANPRGATITRRRTSKPLRAPTTGDNPRGVAIITNATPVTPGEYRSSHASESGT
jgi:hypothetical protein